METGKALNLEELDSAVELLLGFLLFVLLSADSNSHFSWYISATFGPKESVELAIDSNILYHNAFNGGEEDRVHLVATVLDFDMAKF